MKLKKLVICDRDEKYLQDLQEYLTRKKLTDFQIVVYSNILQALEYSRYEPFEILLVGENIYEESVKEIQAANVFILQEDGAMEYTEYPVICKYQSVDRMLSQIMDTYMKAGNFQEITHCGNTKTRLLSFYSPDQGITQTISALSAGQVLANQGRKVLYINLSAFAGFEELLHTQYESDITDFMYFVTNIQRYGSNKLIYKLDSMKHTLHHMDYLPPALDYTDLQEIAEADWMKGLDALLFATDYDDIILDLSEICKALYQILEKSQRIYTVSTNTKAARAKLVQYTSLLEKREKKELLQKTRFVTVFDDWNKPELDYDTLVSSSIGRYMEGVLQEDSE